jgi:cysteine desulfurase
MRVYFDNAASTKVSPSVIEVMKKTMEEDYANPSARHVMGVEAENYYKEAAQAVSKTLKVNPKEIVFTSGGTESNNMALIGAARAYQRSGRHIISTSIEHPAVYEPLAYLKEEGFEISILPVDSLGHISLEELKNTIRKDTVLISAMLVNNEMGAVEPVDEIAALIKSINPQIIFHVDAIQAYGKYRIYPKKSGIDLLSVSGHKLHAPKGVGFLYVNEKIKIKPVVFGGGQQRGLRSGTLNIPGIAGMGKAASEAYEDFDNKVKKVAEIKDYIISELENTEGVSINSQRGLLSAPHVLSVTVKGIRGEVLLHALEAEGIYVASGSACSSNHPGISGTLKGIGLTDEAAASTIRLSFSEYNTMHEADYFLERLNEMLPVLRRFK